MNLILFDDARREHLKPFTFVRPVSEIRMGITTLREKWELALSVKASWETVDYLKVKYPSVWKNDSLIVNGGVLPNTKLLKAIHNLKTGHCITDGNELVAFKGNQALYNQYLEKGVDVFSKAISIPENLISIHHTWDIFGLNHLAFAYDYAIRAENGSFEPLSESVRVTGDLYQADGTPNILLEEGAVVENCYINVKGGPVYIGKNAEVMEGAMLRGPIALCDNAKINMGAKIYGATTIGPYCKVGGEVQNSVFFAYSNKGHDGFLGNSVLAEWCNLGADTNNSNLRNDYGEVRVWNYADNGFAKTGLQFSGLMLGDHSKSGINTMFNTGTVVGVCSNIYGAGFPRAFIPSFLMGGGAGFKLNPKAKYQSMAKLMMERRHVAFTAADKDILDAVFAETEKYRQGLI